jgi:hypothetical protein
MEPTSLLLVVAGQIANSGGAEATGALLKQVIRAQDEEMRRLEALTRGVARLLEGPSRTARHYLEEAAVEGRSTVDTRRYLERAHDALFQAVGLGREGTIEHASDAAQLSLVFGLLGDKPGATRWAVTAFESADKAAAVAAQHACHVIRPGGAMKRYLATVRFLNSFWLDPQVVFWIDVDLAQGNWSPGTDEARERQKLAREDRRRLERGEPPNAASLRARKETQAILAAHASSAQAERHRRMAEALGGRAVPRRHQLKADLEDATPIRYESVARE